MVEKVCVVAKCWLVGLKGGCFERFRFLPTWRQLLPVLLLEKIK
jgi:hypothetical protein